MNVIISVRPNFCQSIFNGSKTFEYRRRLFKRIDVDRVYIYATKPICKIVGYFTVNHVIEDSPSRVWQLTHEGSGIRKEYFDSYFKGCDTAHAIKIKDVVKLDKPIDPQSVISYFHPPQSFMYCDSEIEKLSVCVADKRE